MCINKPVTKRPKKQKRNTQGQYCYPCIVTLVIPIPWSWTTSNTGQQLKRAQAKVISMNIKIK